MARAEYFQEEELRINNIDIVVVSYIIDDVFYCKVENKDPGATICRSQGKTLEEAREQALAKVRQRLQAV